MLIDVYFREGYLNFIFRIYSTSLPLWSTCQLATDIIRNFASIILQTMFDFYISGSYSLHVNFSKCCNAIYQVIITIIMVIKMKIKDSGWLLNFIFRIYTTSLPFWISYQLATDIFRNFASIIFQIIFEIYISDSRFLPINFSKCYNSIIIMVITVMKMRIRDSRCPQFPVLGLM